MERVKKHLRKNKVFYSCAATAVIASGLTLVVVRKSNSGIIVKPLALFSKQFNSFITVVKREGRGHPGYRIRCLENLLEWDSQGEGARVMGISPVALSQHLNHKRDHAGGFHFERILA